MYYKSLCGKYGETGALTPYFSLFLRVNERKLDFSESCIWSASLGFCREGLDTLGNALHERINFLLFVLSAVFRGLEKLIRIITSRDDENENSIFSFLNKYFSRSRFHFFFRKKLETPDNIAFIPRCPNGFARRSRPNKK